MTARRWVIGGVVLVLAASAATYLGAGAFRRVGVEVAVVEEGVVRKTATLTGKLVSLTTASVTSRRAGTIEDVVCRVGDAVGVGDTIALMAAEDLVGHRGVIPRTASERLAQAQADLMEARRDVQRLEAITEETETRVGEAEERSRRIDAAQAALREAERAQEEAERNLQGFASQARWQIVAEMSADLQEAERELSHISEELQRARAAWRAGELGSDEYRALQAAHRRAREKRDLVRDKLQKAQESPEAKAYEGARRAVDRARARVKVRQAELRRAESGGQRMARVAGQADLAEARLTAARERVAELEARVAALERQERAKRTGERPPALDLDTGYMTAPISGTVAELKVKAGDQVGAGQAIATIADVESLTLRADAGPSRAKAIRVGQTAEVYTKPTGDHPFAGVVSRVVPMAGEGRTRIEVLITDDLGKLKPGQQGEAVIDIGSDEPGLLVPDRALTSLPQGQQGVFLAGDGQALAVAVVVVETSGKEARVTGDLQPGDLVVLDPPADLRDGRSITVLNVDSEAEMLEPVEEVLDASP
jgi:RND family efflux transporter MFP subunit